MPIDHFSVVVPKSKFEDIVGFLKKSLEHMGFKEVMRPVPLVVGLGEEFPYFWINSCASEEESEALDKQLSKMHIAFTAENAEQVKKFHEAAIKAGGVDNGPPGLKSQYHPAYYGAFVLDPVCGINFEVVCHNGANN